MNLSSLVPEKKEVLNKAISLEEQLVNLGFNECREEMLKNIGKKMKTLHNSQVDEAREEGYKAGLNLRKEYNDPELIKEIIAQAKSDTIEKAIEIVKEMPYCTEVCGHAIDRQYTIAALKEIK